jgi:hypothetical protein
MCYIFCVNFEVFIAHYTEIKLTFECLSWILQPCLTHLSVVEDFWIVPLELSTQSRYLQIERNALFPF